MKVQKLILKNWKCFRDETTFNFEGNINLIYGENEAGKSTAIEALRRVFFDKHTTSGEKMKAVEPWGGEGLAPNVKVLFKKEDEEYRIEKRFLYSEYSSLEKKVKGDWEKIAEGDAADKEIIDMVGGTLPGRGASKPKNWGMAQALWTQQGKIIPEDEFNTNFKEKIRKMIGEFVPSEQGSEITEKIKSEFESNLTPKTRALRKGGELKELDVKREKQEEKVKELKTKLEETEEIRAKLEDEKIEKKALIEKQEKAEERLENAKEGVEAAEAHKKLREEKEEELSDLENEFKELDDRIEEIEEREGEIDDKEEEKEDLVDKIEEKNDEKESKSEKIDELKEEKDELDKQLDKKENNLEDFRLVNQIIQKKKEMELISNKLENAIELKEKIKDLEQEIEEIEAPDKGEFEELKEIHDELREKEIQMETIGLQANIIAKSELEGDIYLDDEKEFFELTEGDEKEWTTPQNLSLKIDELIDVNIKSGSEDVKELKERIDELKGQFEAKTDVYETNEIEELRGMMQKLKDLKRQVRGSKENFKDIELPKLPSIEETNGVCPFCDNEHRDGEPYGMETYYENHVQDCASEKDEINLLKILKKRKKKQMKIKWNQIDNQDIVEDYKSFKDIKNKQNKIEKKINDLKGDKEKLKSNKKSLKQEIEGLEKEVDNIDQEISEIKEEKNGLRGELRTARKELEDLKDDGMAMDERKEKRDKIEVEVKKVEDRVNDLQDEKKKKEDRPFKELEQAEKSFNNIEEEINKVENKISKLKGQLKEKVKEGIHSKLTKAQEKLSSLKREKERKGTKVRAIEMLHDLINYHKKESMRTVMKPLEDSINEDLERIIGREKYNVNLSKGIKPDTIKPTTWNTKADTDLLSYGTKEQIAFSFRLSLGNILSEEEKQLVILDDPLANTDNPRLHRSIGVLEEYSKNLQIILITCDKTKYSGLSDPNIIEL